MKKRFLTVILTLAVLCGLYMPTAFAIGTTSIHRSNIVILTGAHTGLVDAEGGLWMWGTNQDGQLAIDDVDTKPDYEVWYQSYPVQVMDGVVSIAATSNATLALKEDNSLWFWGYSGLYKSLTGIETDSRTIKPTKIMDDVAVVCAAGNFAVIKTDGSLWIAGSNTYGQLGVPELMDPDNHRTTNSQYRPFTKVMDGVKSVSGGSEVFMALKEDGTLWGWGRNDHGQVGSAETSVMVQGVGLCQLEPKLILEDVKAVSCGGSHTLAIKTDNTLWSWGENNWYQTGTIAHEGQAGNNVSRYYYNPTPFQLMEDVIYCYAGYSNGAAITSDNVLWGWGLIEINGQRAEYRDATDHPKQLMTDVAEVYLNDTSILIKTDGSAWAWGSDVYGRVGNGPDSGPGFKIEDAVRLDVPAARVLTPGLERYPDLEWIGKNDPEYEQVEERVALETYDGKLLELYRLNDYAYYAIASVNGNEQGGMFYQSLHNGEVVWEYAKWDRSPLDSGELMELWAGLSPEMPVIEDPPEEEPKESANEPEPTVSVSNTDKTETGGGSPAAAIIGVLAVLGGGGVAVAAAAFAVLKKLRH